MGHSLELLLDLRFSMTCLLSQLLSGPKACPGCGLSPGGETRKEPHISPHTQGGGILQALMTGRKG